MYIAAGSAPNNQSPGQAYEHEVLPGYGVADVVSWTDGGRPRKGPSRRSLPKVLRCILWLTGDDDKGFWYHDWNGQIASLSTTITLGYKLQLIEYHSDGKSCHQDWKECAMTDERFDKPCFTRDDRWAMGDGQWKPQPCHVCLRGRTGACKSCDALTQV